MNAPIRNVNLDVTTFCDRACPNCCAATNGKLFRPQVHHDWPYFERAAKVLYGIERVLLCGGEPTFHPDFATFVPRFKDLFGCKTLAMVTDGWGVVKYWKLIRDHIDHIDYTDYHNRPALTLDCRDLPQYVSIFDAGPRMENFTPRSRVGGGNPCERAWWRSGTIAYADGKVYGCCVAPGIEGAIGSDCDDPVILSLPCGTCFFSE